MHLDVCLYVENCVLIGLDWVEPMMQCFLHTTCSCIFHAYVPFIFYLLVLCCDGSLSLSLSLSRIVCAWHPSTNLLHLGTLHVLRHLLLTLLFFTYGSVIRRPIGLLEKLLLMWCSFEAPCSCVGIFRY